VRPRGHGLCSAARMLNFIRFTGIIVVSGSIAWACSGADSTQGSNEHGGASGAGPAGAGGDVVQVGSGSSGSSAGQVGSAGSVSNAGSGGSSSVAGASGAAGTSAGSSGAGGASISAFGCAKDDDCIVGYGHINKGCCYRGCGSAYNRNFVASDPCTSSDPMSDPVPASCDTGCTACPASQCQVVYGSTCLAEQCTSVTQYGPCATDDDCVVAVDYASQQGGCCSCPEITNKLVLANNRCIVLKGQPKPDGCAPTPAGVCNTLGCPAQCPNPTILKCDKAVCKGS
jgi:hypothetical protein